MQYHSKSYVRANGSHRRSTFRPQVEYLEGRIQPGSVLPFSEFSMIGQDLFDRDPLTGRQTDHTSDISQVVASTDPSGAGEFSPVAVQQVQIVPTSANQTVVSAPVAMPARDLALAASMLPAASRGSELPTPLGVKGINFAAPVVTQMPYQVQPTQAAVVAPVPVLPMTGLQVQTTVYNGSGQTAGPGPTDFTGFDGEPGPDVANAVTVDDNGNSFYTGYTSVNGDRDFAVWKVNPSGTVREWKTVFVNPGDDEGRDINTCGQAAVLCVTGSVSSPAGDTDLFIVRLLQEDGSLVVSRVVATAGNDSGNAIKHNGDHSVAFVSGTVNDNQLFAGAFTTHDLEPIYANGYEVPGLSNPAGDSITVTPREDSIIVGSSPEGAFLAKIDSLGTPLYAGVLPTLGAKFSGVDFQRGSPGFFYVTGEIPVDTPTLHTRMLIGKFQDSGQQFTQVWGFFAWTYNFGGVPGSLAGNDIRVDQRGYSYVMCELWGPTEDRDEGDNDAHIFKVGQNGNTQTASFHYGTEEFPALFNDKGLGIAMTEDRSGTRVWTTGKANSPDFPVSPEAYQTWHADGDGYTPDGFVSSINLPGV